MMQNAKGAESGSGGDGPELPTAPVSRGQAEVGLAALRAALPRRGFLGCFIFPGLILWPFVIPRHRGELGKLEITGGKFPPPPGCRPGPPHPCAQAPAAAGERNGQRVLGRSFGRGKRMARIAPSSEKGWRCFPPPRFYYFDYYCYHRPWERASPRQRRGARRPCSVPRAPSPGSHRTDKESGKSLCTGTSFVRAQNLLRLPRLIWISDPPRS